MAELDREISAFENKRTELEKHHLGKWVVFHDEAVAGVFDTFNAAATDAVRRFGRGPYLIRQVGAKPVTVPAAFAAMAAHADY